MNASEVNQIPVLLLAWRRPSAVERVIDALRTVSPATVYVSCDGPRDWGGAEGQKVTLVRNAIDKFIDWECNVYKLYHNTNQGCYASVTTAISWFFDHVKFGIILEDDCVPHEDFFSLCSALNHRFANDHRIWSICGSNFQAGARIGQASYYFSINGDSWGWATWARAWNVFPAAKRDWAEFRDSDRFSDVFPIPCERTYWRNLLDDQFSNPSSLKHWDYEWWLASWMNNALHAWSNVPLIKNIGYGDDASHTKSLFPFGRCNVAPLGPITHPTFVLPSRDADRHAFMWRRGGKEIMERERYRFLYPWILRYREVDSKGLRVYLSSAVSRLFKRISRFLP
jgi:hypothetical protein